MSKPGKSLKNNQRIILTKLENIVCGDMERLCSKPILDGYNARLRQLGIEINIYEFYIKKGDGYKLKKNYKILLNKKFNKKNQKKSLEKAKEIQQKLIEIDNETKQKLDLLEKDLQKKFSESLKKDQEEQEYADRLMRRLDELNPEYENKMSGKVINSKKEVNNILKRKNNNTNMLDSGTMKSKEIKKISKDTNIPYKKIALALGLTGLGGGLLYMNTRKGNKKTKKNKKRKFGTKSMTLDRYKDQVKNTIKKYVDKNKKVKDYSLKVRGCFKEQHLKKKKYRNFLRYYQKQQRYNKERDIVLDEYINKRLKIFNNQYKKMQKIYNNLRYTTSANRLDFLSIMQHPALTKEEKNFILKEINKTENYDENMRSHFIRIVEKLYPIPTIFKDLSLEQISDILINDNKEILLDELDPSQPWEQYREQAREIIREVKYLKNNHPEILWNKERLDEIISDVYKKDITEEYVEKFLYKEMKKNGLFIDKDGILKMKEDSKIIKKAREDFRTLLYKERSNHFNKLGRIQDFSHVDLSGIKLNYGIFPNCNFKGANLKGSSLHFCNLKGANLEGANLEGADLLGANLLGANLRGAMLYKVTAETSTWNNAKLQGANLNNAYLGHGKMIGANLQGAKLRKANLEEVNLQYARLQKADLTEAILFYTDLKKANLQGANLQNANLSHAFLQKIDLRYTNLKGANLYKTKLKEADLLGVDLWGNNLKGASLIKAKLRRANVQYADLRGAILLDANLQGAELYKAKLQGARLQDADLQGANLEGANLEGAKLQRADLYETNLKGANLKGANLKRAVLQGTDLRGANLRGAILFGVNLNGAKLKGANLYETIWRERENPFIRRESQYDTALQPDEISSDEEVEMVGYDEGDVSALSGVGGIL